MYHNKNVTIISNVIGFSSYKYERILIKQPDILCMIDIPFFEPRNYSNVPVPFN